MRLIEIAPAFVLAFLVTSVIEAAEVVHIGEQLAASAAIDAKLSADGNYVAGTLTVPGGSGYGPPVIWSREEGLTIVDSFSGGLSAEAHGISADGSTFVGNFGPNDLAACRSPHEAFTWSESTDLFVLQRPENVRSLLPYAISDDGRTVVGYAVGDVVSCQEYIQNAFSWSTDRGLTLLDLPNGKSESAAWDVSADGRVTVGVAFSQNLDDFVSWDAVMWNDQGVQTLGTMPDDWQNAAAYLVSADGTTIVGSSQPAFAVADEWFRWTNFDGFVALPKLSPSHRGVPKAISADGSVIVGAFLDSKNDIISVVWDEKHGARDLRQVLIDEHGFSHEDLGDLSIVVDLSHDTTNLLAHERAPAGAGAYAYDVIILDKPLVSPLGDLNNDHYRTPDDFDLLAQAVKDASGDLQFDLNLDEVVDENDQTYWVHSIARTYFGDANLDGEFNSSDLVTVFEAGQYEDNVAGNSGWATGDWNGDADFNTSDLVLAFQDGGYERGPRSAVTSVPEPTTGWLLTMGVPLVIRRFLRHKG